LRAIAVLSVVLYHTGVSFVGGGYVGVDVFFVISGYLITGQIYQELIEGRFTVSGFYERRIRRIIPALLFVILLCIPIALVLLLPPAMADFSASVVATATFLSNVYFWSKSGYFDPASQTLPLLHTWSLAVEEQFYVMIPLIMMAVVPRLRRWAALPLAFIAGVSFALGLYMTEKAPSGSFFLLPTRAWELLIGSLLVFVPPIAIGSRTVREVVGVTGLGLIAYAVVTFTNDTPFPGAAALLPTVGAALLIFVGRDSWSLTSALLAIRPLVAIGLISYSLYLVHWPMIVFTRYYLLIEPGAVHIVMIIAASLALATFSWHFVERPFRRPRRQPGSRRAAFAATATALAVVVVLGGLGAASGGFRSRFPAFELASPEEVARSHWRVNVCLLVDQPHDAWKAEECTRTTGASRNALLWGDSFAAHYVPGLVRNADKLSANIIQYTFAGCPPILSYYSFAIPDCQKFNERATAVIERFNVKTVILSARWDLLRQRGVEGLSDTIERLTERGIEVFVLGPSPTFSFDPKVLAYRGAGMSADGSAAWTISFDPAESARVRKHAGSGTFIDPLTSLCHGPRCLYMIGGSYLFTDYGHFSPAGSDVAVRAYFPLYHHRQRTLPVRPADRLR
jgi:peptidoglycan/LPS O-acetylase OafA/YrhL